MTVMMVISYDGYDSYGGYDVYDSHESYDNYDSYNSYDRYDSYDSRRCIHLSSVTPSRSRTRHPLAPLHKEMLFEKEIGLASGRQCTILGTCLWLHFDLSGSWHEHTRFGS